MVLEKVTGQTLAESMQDRLLTPLALDNTFSLATPEIPEPALHAFSGERRAALGIPNGMRFYEESSFWNPSWTLAQGSIQVTNIYDMTATAEAIGAGTTLSPESHAEMIAPKLLGFGAPLEGCLTCHTLDEAYSYGLGVVISGEWILQNPLFGGYGAIEAVLPSDKIAIAVSTTFGEKGFGEDGSYLHSRASWTIFAQIAALLAPDKAPAVERK
jgi:CubicO group peptidase (beta-lactamase class C family)